MSIDGNAIFLEVLKHVIEIEKQAVIKELSFCTSVAGVERLKAAYLGRDSFVAIALRALDGTEESFNKLLVKMGAVNGSKKRED